MLPQIVLVGLAMGRCSLAWLTASDSEDSQPTRKTPSSIQPIPEYVHGSATWKNVGEYYDEPLDVQCTNYDAWLGRSCDDLDVRKWYDSCTRFSTKTGRFETIEAVGSCPQGTACLELLIRSGTAMKEGRLDIPKRHVKCDTDVIHYLKHGTATSTPGMQSTDRFTREWATITMPAAAPVDKQGKTTPAAAGGEFHRFRVNVKVRQDYNAASVTVIQLDSKAGSPPIPADPKHPLTAMPIPSAAAVPYCHTKGDPRFPGDFVERKDRPRSDFSFDHICHPVRLARLKRGDIVTIEGSAPMAKQTRVFFLIEQDQWLV